MKNYPSNITRQQFELIRPALENFRKRTKPRKYDLYEVFCAVLYVLKTGCQWRQVPGDFPDCGQFTTITKFGQLKLSLRLILYWNKF